MCSLINKQLLLTAYAYLFIMEQQKDQQGSEALQVEKTGQTTFEQRLAQVRATLQPLREKGENLGSIQQFNLSTGALLADEISVKIVSELYDADLQILQRCKHFQEMASLEIERRQVNDKWLKHCSEEEMELHRKAAMATLNLAKSTACSPEMSEDYGIGTANSSCRYERDFTNASGEKVAEVVYIVDNDGVEAGVALTKVKLLDAHAKLSADGDALFFNAETHASAMFKGNKADGLKVDMGAGLTANVGTTVVLNGEEHDVKVTKNFGVSFSKHIDCNGVMCCDVGLRKEQGETTCGLFFVKVSVKSKAKPAGK